MPDNPIIFFGNGPLSTIPLERIQSAGLNLISTIHSRADLTALPELIRQSSKPPIGILASYGQLIKPDLLALFEPIGIINLHPSLLPLYRGPSPIETAILDGATSTGISIMRLAEAMDAGPLYAQQTIPLTGTESKAELYQRLSTIGIDILLDLLPAIVAGTHQPTPQPTTSATYTNKLDKSMAPLDPERHSALDLTRQIRAFLGFPRSRLTLRGLDCIVTAAHAAPTPTTDLDLLCADGQYLCIDRLIPAGSRELTAAAFLIGH
jgi:methionyl-tRNA formyltransferase